MRRFLVVALAAVTLSLVFVQRADAVVIRAESEAGRPVELDVTGQTITVTFINPRTGDRLTNIATLAVRDRATGRTQTFQREDSARLAPGTYDIQASLFTRGAFTGISFRPTLDVVTF